MNRLAKSGLVHELRKGNGTRDSFRSILICIALEITSSEAYFETSNVKSAKFILPCRHFIIGVGCF